MVNGLPGSENKHVEQGDGPGQRDVRSEKACMLQFRHDAFPWLQIARVDAFQFGICRAAGLIAQKTEGSPKRNQRLHGATELFIRGQRGTERRRCGLGALAYGFLGQSAQKFLSGAEVAEQRCAGDAAASAICSRDACGVCASVVMAAARSLSELRAIKRVRCVQDCFASLLFHF